MIGKSASRSQKKGDPGLGPDLLRAGADERDAAQDGGGGPGREAQEAEEVRPGTEARKQSMKTLLDIFERYLEEYMTLLTLYKVSNSGLNTPYSVKKCSR